MSKYTTESSLLYLSRKVDNIKESAGKAIDRFDNRLSRLRRRLVRLEFEVKDIIHFIQNGPHAAAYELHQKMMQEDEIYIKEGKYYDDNQRKT